MTDELSGARGAGVSSELSPKAPGDGGPAFPMEEFVPFPGGGGRHVRHGGMSLRDWFAGQALAGILANADISATAARLKVTTADFRRDAAAAAYAIADEALAERAKGGGS